MADWLIAKVMSRRVRMIQEALARLDIESFIPCCVQRFLRRGQWKERIVPLFPGYLFVLSPHFWYYLYKIYGIFGVVRGSSAAAAPLRSNVLDREVNKLKGMRNIHGLLPCPDPMKPYYRPIRFLLGDQVRIISGVFRGYTGTFEREKGSRADVILDSGVRISAAYEAVSRNEERVSERVSERVPERGSPPAPRKYYRANRTRSHNQDSATVAA